MTARLKSIPRTGETELHKIGAVLERVGHMPFVATEKLDGFSMSLGTMAGKFIASTRTRMIDPDGVCVFARAIEDLNLRREWPKDTIFQGELCGPGIQGNRYNLPRLRLFIFDILSPHGYMNNEQIRELSAIAGLETVPVVADGFLPTRELCGEFATGRSRLYPDTEREGCVFRPMVEADDEYQGRVSFKVFNPEYAFHH